jgi:hypothetical protein
MGGVHRLITNHLTDILAVNRDDVVGTETGTTVPAVGGNMGRNVALALLLGVTVLFSVLLARCTNGLSTSCTVGYAGTNLNITVEGWGAGNTCQNLMKSAPGGAAAANGQTPLGSGYDSSPGGTLMCRYNLNGLTYTVHDSGALNLYGNAACAALAAQTPAARAAAKKQAQDEANAAAAAQAQAAAAAAAQQRQAAQAAIDSAAQALTSDLVSLGKAKGEIDSVLGGDALSAASKDYGAEQQDAQKTRAEPDHYAACSDAYTVQSDAYTVQSDQYSLQRDGYSLSSAVKTLQDQVSQANHDYQLLVSAEAALSSYQPPDLPSQDAVNQATSAAQNAIDTGNHQYSSEQSQMQSLVDQAAALASSTVKAYC